MIYQFFDILKYIKINSRGGIETLTITIVFNNERTMEFAVCENNKEGIKSILIYWYVNEREIITGGGIFFLNESKQRINTCIRLKKGLKRKL